MTVEQEVQSIRAKLAAQKLARQQACDREPGGDYHTPCDEESFSDACRDAEGQE